MNCVFPKLLRQLLELLLALLIGVSGVICMGWLGCLNQPLDLVNYQLNGLALPRQPWLWCIPLVGALLMPVIAWIRGDFYRTLSHLNRMFFPLPMASIAILLAPNSYWTALLLILFSGIACCRAITAWSAELLVKHRFRKVQHYIPCTVTVLFFLAVIWGYFLQRRAYDCMFLYYSDWCEYAENYLQIAFGGDRSLLRLLATGGHWNPFPTVLMVLLLRIFPSPDLIFIINSIVIYSSIPLGYALARAQKLPVYLSLFWGVMAFLCPVIANQPLSLFYGFHPINFMIPTVLGFFICRAQNRYTGMIALFLLSLLIQETTTVFWAGYALYLLLKRRYILGIFLFGVSCLLFLLLVSVVIPRLFSFGGYTQMFHYGNLGTSPCEVALSPFLRPAVFWETVFQWQNFAFVTGLLVPVWLVVVIRPRLAVVALPLLAGICLQGSPELKNLVMQYGLEITTLLYATAIINSGAVYHGISMPLLKLINCGIPATRHRIAGATGVTGATFVCGIMLFVLFGQYPWQRVRNLPSGTKVLQHLFSRIPDGCQRIVATQRLRAHALFERPSSSLETELRPGDVVMLDLHDPSNAVYALERIRAELSMRNSQPIASANWFGSQLVCFSVDPFAQVSSPPPYLRVIGEDEFKTMGQSLPCAVDDFELRLHRTKNDTGVLLVRLHQKIDYDVDLDVHFQQGENERHIHLVFAYGLFPAYSQPAGQVFLLPLSGKFPERIAVEIIRRPESGPRLGLR